MSQRKEGFIGEAQIFKDRLRIHLTHFDSGRPCLVALDARTGEAWGRLTANVDNLGPGESERLAHDEMLFKYRHQVEDLEKAGLVRGCGNKLIGGLTYHVARLSAEITNAQGDHHDVA